MRMLIPDEIATGDRAADAAATRHLGALRDATVETLGRPLLAAFMPNFSVTPVWLDSLDTAAGARALRSLRDTLASATCVDAVPPPPDPQWICGVTERDRFVASAATGLDAALPLLIAPLAENGALAERLASYRAALVELFEQTARSADAVRLNRMTQPNHVLDDRLWHLVGSIGETFGDVAAAREA
jgi:hypothetical protein